MKSNIELTIAKLELKQLEVIDKLSEKHDDYVIRCITCPDTTNLLAVNGDWEKVTGFKEKMCVGIPLNEFVSTTIITSLVEDDFVTYSSNMVIKDGSSINITWKSKHFPDINSIVSIGRIKR